MTGYLRVAAAVLGCLAGPVFAAPLTLHFHGNPTDDPPCSGVGAADVELCGGPFLRESPELGAGPPAHWDATSLLSNSTPQGLADPSWTWTVAAPTTVGGYTVVEWWASCDICIAAVPLPNNWTLSVWVDGVQQFAQDVSATPAVPFVPSLLTAGILLPPLTVTQSLTLKIDANYVDAQAEYQIFYDSVLPCPGSAGGACDSRVTFDAPQPDADSDGVVDTADQCAGTPAGSPVNEHGCRVPAVSTTVATSTPGVPRYQVSFPTEGTVAGIERAGEFNIGFNPKTGNLMAMSALSGLVWRITPPELLDPNQPESCPCLWQDKSPISTASGLQPIGDPILVTDQDTGRTFASNLMQGPHISYAFSDDDGENWFPFGVSGINGADHQTIGVGPYPADSPYKALAEAAGYPNAVYYCSQDGLRNVGPVGCVRSDDGGRIWGPVQIAMAGDPCGGLHGHLKVAPDGTAFIPVKSCGPMQGAAVTFDAGDTWTATQVPDSWKQANGSDPSIGIDRAGTLYFCYVNGDGHPHVQVSEDRGATWTRDTDLGAALGVQNAVFAQAVAGSAGRAACGFLGTTTGGANFESLDFDGIWHLYIATTYDGGRTWVTVNATPDDPVQGVGGICLAGLDCGPNRNLLDFNEVTIDDRGRVQFGFDDGCVGACVTDPVNAVTREGQMRVARQTGGRTLYAAYDAHTDTTAARPPERACLSGTRDAGGARLSWLPGDDGGAAVTGWQVFRGTSPGAEALLATIGPAAGYVDATADPAVPVYHYYVKAVNAAGVSDASNPVALVPGATVEPESACVLPGLTLVRSPAGLTGNGLPSGHDDLRSIAFAEPARLDEAPLADRLVITMKVATLDPVPPPGYRWLTYFRAPGSTEDYWAAMSTVSGPQPVFNWGKRHVVDLGLTTASSFTTLGTLDPASHWKPDGTITLVFDTQHPALDRPLQPGDVLTGIAGAVRQSSPEATEHFGLTVDQATAIGPYTVIGNAACVPNAAPVAALSADPLRARTRTPVRFSGAGSSDPDAGDAIVSYTFEFGDGVVVTQASPETSHEYARKGTYLARLTVTDSHGKLSTNRAEVAITVDNRKK